MNYWIFSTIALITLLVFVLIWDSRMFHKLNSMADASDSETRAWMRECERLRIEIDTRDQRDARLVAHKVMIRDEEIDNLKRTMASMEAKHRKELDLREKRIYTLEKQTAVERTAKAGEKK